MLTISPLTLTLSPQGERDKLRKISQMVSFINDIRWLSIAWLNYYSQAIFFIIPIIIWKTG
jgi:hypothetical protein